MINQENRQIRFVLASASPRRAELIRQIGIEAEIIPSRIEEKIASDRPDRIVMELSVQKAEEVAGRLRREQIQEEQNGDGGYSRRTVVIGSDTVVSVDGRILGKPADREDAKSMLGQIQGRRHEVYTGVTLICGELKKTFAVETKVEVYPMTESEIEAYLDCGESMDKAGAYGIQGRFAAHIKGIEGSYTNVVGLPVGRLYQEIKQLAAEWPEE